MFRMYGNFQFKLERDYYVNIKNDSYFQLTKTNGTENYNVVFYSKEGKPILEKNFTAKNNKFEKELEQIVADFEKKYS